MLGYFILGSTVLAVALYFLIKCGIACDCSCHDGSTFKCSDTCDCLCHDDHLYAFKTKVVGYFTGLYNKIKRK